MNRIDLLGGNMNIYHNGNDRLKTNFGGVLTIFLAILFVLAVYSFGSNFFRRVQPLSSISTISPLEYPFYNINKNNFTFAFRIENPDGQSYRDDASVYLGLVYSEYSKDNGGVWLKKDTIMNLTTCTEDMIVDKDFAARTDLETLLCVDFNDKIFGGFWDSDFIGRFMLFVFACDEGYNNILNNEKCKTDKEKELVLPINNLYLSLFYQHNIIDLKNYEKGLKSIIKNDYFRLDKNLYKLKYLYFKETIMNSDYGWLVENKKEERVLGFSSTYLDIVTSPILTGESKIKGILGATVVYGAREIDIISREYAKIQTLAAEVGGILKFFVSVMSILANQYAIYNTQLKFSNFYLSENDNSIDNLITKSKKIKLEQPENNLNAKPKKYIVSRMPIDDHKNVRNQNIGENNLKNSVDKIYNNFMNSEQIEIQNKREVEFKEEIQEKSNQVSDKIEDKCNIINNSRNFIRTNVSFKETLDMFLALNICYRSFYKEKYFQFKTLNEKFIQNFQIEDIINEKQDEKYLKYQNYKI